MCGIAGIVDCSGQDSLRLRASVQRMCETLAHRGPDDWGIITLHGARLEHRSMGCPEGEYDERARPSSAEQTVIFGHRRLAIIDLSPGGHQPMGTADGRFWITFNGEIYNYRELRRELESDGMTFRSGSDTEVLLALTAREGPHCLHKLRGMFAFALWDEEKRELFLARDRFGMKPLYYIQSSKGPFLFSSELKALLSSGWVSGDMDQVAETAFLQRGCIPAPKTFYREIEAMPPAHWAKWDGKGLSIRPYWSLYEAVSSFQNLKHETRKATEIANYVRQALVDSVKAHMVSDVPVGLFLSGGLDSTAVVAAVRQFYSGPLRTFTITFPGTQWDESALARQAADYYATDHTELEVTKDDFFEGLDDLFFAMDQPTSDGYNSYFVSKCVRQAGEKVALSGLGGDEILGGYKSFVHVPMLQKYLGLVGRVPWLPGLASNLAQQLPLRSAPKLAQLLRSPPGSIETLWQEYRGLFTDRQLLRLGQDRTQQAAGNMQKAEDRKLPARWKDPFWSVAFLEIDRFMVPQLLRDADVFSMCHGLELRTPFVDHLFLSSVLEVGKWPRDGAESYKIALFQNMNGFLPPEHLLQRKRGFVFPFEVWLREALSNGTSSGVSRDLRLLLDKPYYRPFVEGFVRGKVHWSRIWSLYVLERFKDELRDQPVSLPRTWFQFES
ncbi:MAG: asparagine synthase (glutamine-hydrolyzing) [Candidatus Binatia bacterium]